MEDVVISEGGKDNKEEIKNNPVYSDDAAQKQLANRIISYVSALSQNKLNWFWQLLANGLERVDSKIPFEIHLAFKQNMVEFSHTGKPFTKENLQAIVDQTSTKPQQLGLGFMSVIKLTQNIQVHGVLEGIQEGKNNTFSLLLHRPLDSINRLTTQIKISKDSLSELPPIKQIQPLLSGFTTRFRLFTHNNFDEEIQTINQNLIYLFAFNPQLSKISLTTNGTTKIYPRPSFQQDEKLKCKALQLEIETVKVNKLFLLQDQDITVALPVYKNSKQTVLQAVAKNSSIFKGYPLSETIKLPFIINCSKFQLDINRSGLSKSVTNQKIIENSFKISFDLIQTVIPNIKRRQLLFNFKVSPQYQSLKLNHSYKEFISPLPLVLLNNSKYSSLSQIRLPLIQSSNYVPETFISLSQQFFSFANRFLQFPLEQQAYKSILGFVFQDLQDWLKYIKQYNLKQFIAELANIDKQQFITTVNSMNKYKSTGEDLIIDFVNDFYSFLQREFPVELLNRSNRIALNYNYRITPTKELFFLKNPVPSSFFDFIESEFGFSIKDILLAPGINHDLFDLNEYNINNALQLFVNSFVDKEQLEVIDQIRLFKFICSYSKEQLSKSSASIDYRKDIFQAFKYLKIFKGIPQTICESELKIDYQPYIQKLVDSVFFQVSSSFQSLQSLQRLLEIQNPDQVIEWFNNFKALLNKIHYDKDLSRNLNRNGLFINASQLLVADKSITQLEIDLFNKLPVEICLRDNSQSFRCQMIQQILLHPKIHSELFEDQRLSPLSIQELLTSMIPKFNLHHESSSDMNNETSQLMLDYCDDLLQLSQNQSSEDIDNKLQIMGSILQQMAQSLPLLRLNKEQDKRFIWRLMKDRRSFQGLKQLRSRFSLQTIITNARQYPSLQQQYRDQNNKFKIMQEQTQKQNKQLQLQHSSKLNIKDQQINKMISKHQEALSFQKMKLRNCDARVQQLNLQNSQLKLKIVQMNELKQNQIRLEQQKQKQKQKQEQVNKIKELPSSEIEIVEGLPHNNQQFEKYKKFYDQNHNIINEYKEKLQSKDKIITDLENLRKKEEQKMQEMALNFHSKIQDAIQKLNNKSGIQQNEKYKQQVQKLARINQQLRRQSRQLDQTRKKRHRNMKQQSLTIEQLDEIIIEAQRKKSEEISQNHKQQLQVFYKILQQQYNYDKELDCFIVHQGTGQENKAYLMIVRGNLENYITHQVLNKIYKIKTNLYIGIVGEHTTQDSFIKELDIYSLCDLEIDKWYSSLKEAESRKNAAVRAKAGKGQFSFQYLIKPSAKNRIKPKTFEQFKTQINKKVELKK